MPKSAALRALWAFCGFFALAVPALADGAAVAAIDSLRSEAGRVERLLYRAASPEREAALDAHLLAAAAAWAVAGLADADLAGKVQHWQAAAETGDAAATARARQVMWAGLTATARDAALAAIDAGDAVTAGTWLTLRDYARASGDTSASAALQALAAGKMTPDAARAAVEAELLTVAASELRLAIGQAQDDAAAGHAIQLAGDLGRIEGLLHYLSASLAADLGSDALPGLTAALVRAESDPAALDLLADRLAAYAPVRFSAEEQLRRAQLLRRFTEMVGQEYGLGVKDGQITIAAEYAEAQIFRDRAVAILADLGPQFDDPATAGRLAALYERMKTEIAARSAGVQGAVDEALALIHARFGAAAAAGRYRPAALILPLSRDSALPLAPGCHGAAVESEAYPVRLLQLSAQSSVEQQ